MDRPKRRTASAFRKLAKEYHPDHNAGNPESEAKFKEISEAYERLILDALNGDGTLFIRGDEAETSWGLLSPVLDYWQDQRSKGLESYAAGTWGPISADKLLLSRGHEWLTGTNFC